MQQKIKDNLGFTLIELLITITVIGILAAGVLITVNPLTQIQKARDAQRKSDLKQIQRALEQYYQDNGQYPASSTTSPQYRIMNNGSAVDWGGSFSPYAITLPKDPVSGKSYVYYAPIGYQYYFLYASLDRPNDPHVCTGGANPWCKTIDANTVDFTTQNPDACGGRTASPCNYGVSSPNTTP